MTSALPISRDDARRALRAAFAAQQRPADAALAWDAPEDPAYEGSQARRIFERLRTWQDFDPALLLTPRGFADTDLLSFLTPDGFAYFLPGFLWHALDFGASAAHAALADAVVFGLTPPGAWHLEPLDDPAVQAELAAAGLPGGHEVTAADSLHEHFAAKLVGLTEPQRAAIAGVLACLEAARGERGDEDGPTRALDALWRRYLGVPVPPTDGGMRP